MGGSIVDADVHLTGVVVKVNARDVVWIVVVVGGLALPLHLCSSRVPSHVPLVDFVVGIVSRVNITVVHVGIVDASGGRRAAGARAVGSRTKVLAGAGVDSHDAGGRVGNVLARVSDDVNFRAVDGDGHTGVAPRGVAGSGQISEFFGGAGVALIAQCNEFTRGVEVGAAETRHRA